MLKPANKEELKKIINKRILTEGYKCNLNDIDVSDITDISGLFSGRSFNGDISEWNVSKVTNMSRMFEGDWSWGEETDDWDDDPFIGFNGDISRWDVSNVTDMSRMFNCSTFNGDISQWNVSKVTDMSGMFNFSKFNGDISQWNVSKVTDMSDMFQCSAFNGDISRWDVSNVKNMSSMFYRSAFNGDISEWNVSEKISSQDSWVRHTYLRKQFLTKNALLEKQFLTAFLTATPLNKKDILKNLIQARVNLFGTKCDLNDLDVSDITDMSGMFSGSSFNGDISKWDVSNVKNMS